MLANIHANTSRKFQTEMKTSGRRMIRVSAAAGKLETCGTRAPPRCWPQVERDPVNRGHVERLHHAASLFGNDVKGHSYSLIILIILGTDAAWRAYFGITETKIPSHTVKSIQSNYLHTSE